MRLGVGLIAHSPQWEQLLKQEGVPFTYIDVAEPDEWPCVVVATRSLLDSERRKVEAYLGNGGAIFGYAAHFRGVCGTTTRSEKIEYLLADHDHIFPDIHIIDLAVNGAVPGEANCLKTQQNIFAVFAGELGGGYAVLLPFDPADASLDHRSANKSFYATRERLPSERVSLVGKGEAQHLLHRALGYLHRLRKMPYVHLWYFPDDRKNVFVFRIDSDKGSRREIDELYSAAIDNGIRMSWFLDTKAHEDWLHHFAFLSGQEFGIHCYEHRTFDTYDDNLKNILKARHKLNQAGVSSPGFSAPYGIWHESLAKAIDNVGFEYSSEFSFAYDSLPIYPSIRESVFGTLQVPIHPICIGSLRRIGYTETQMKEYFVPVIDAKLERDEPLTFYHHPTHHCWDVVRFMFQYVKGKNIPNMTMLEYALWWKKRLRCALEVSTDNDVLTIRGARDCDESIRLRVLHHDTKEAIIPVSESVSLASLDWVTRADFVMPPQDIRRTREFDPREMLGDLITTINRKFSEGKSDK